MNSQRLEFSCRLLLVTMGTDQQIVNLTNQEGVHLTRANPITGFEYVDKYAGSTHILGSL